MKKVDVKKVKYLLFLDTETIGSLYVKETIMPFEIGVKVYDNEKKEVVKEKSFLVKKFFNNKYVMGCTFSAGKYPSYIDKAETDKRYKIANVKTIAEDITKLLKKYNINIMVAHNANFDKTALANLFNEFGVENPLADIDLLDTMEVSKVITYSREYTDYCIANKDMLDSMKKESLFLTNSGRVRTTAQAIYSFIIGDPHFKEAHTGLEDIDNEITIYEESLKRLGNTLFNLNVEPTWRDYSTVELEEE